MATTNSIFSGNSRFANDFQTIIDRQVGLAKERYLMQTLTLGIVFLRIVQTHQASRSRFNEGVFDR